MSLLRVPCIVLLSASMLVGFTFYQKTHANEKNSEPVLPFEQKTGGSGDFLTAIYAARIDDSIMAAQSFNKVLSQDKTDEDLQKKAFLYSVLAGSPQAGVLARQHNLGGIAALVLGNEAVMQGRWKEALDYYKLSSGDPLSQLISELLQAWCFFGDGQVEKAFTVLDNGMKTSPLMGMYVFHQGLMDFLRGKNEQAGLAFSRSSQVYGTDLLLTEAYGHWLFMQGRPGKAESILHDLVMALPTLSIAESDLKKSLRQFPIKNAQQAMGQVYLAMASFIEQNIASLQSDDEGNSPGAKKIFLHSEQIALRFALELDPNLAAARLMLANILVEENHVGHARTLLLGVKEDDPLHAVVQLRLARIDGFSGRMPEAQIILKKLITQYPKQADPWQTLGDIALDQKQYKEAVAAYTKAIQIRHTITAMDWPVLLARAIAYENSHQWLKAQKDLEHAIQLVPNEAVLLNYLGYSWVIRNTNLKKAQAMLQRAVEIAPDEPAIRDSLGWAMIKNNQLQDGVKQLESAAEKIPEDPELNYHLGVAYWKLNRLQEAIDQWNMALNAHPTPEDKVQILKALQKAKAIHRNEKSAQQKRK